jgi:hypothetical protein
LKFKHFIGGKGKAGSSSLHNTLEGPMEHVNARWISSHHGFPYGIKWIMCHGYLDYVQNLSFGGRPNTIMGDLMAFGILTTVDFLYYIMCEALQ